MSLNKRINLVVKNALKEDVGCGDITTSLSVPLKLKGEACIVAQEGGTLCGITVAKTVFKQLDKTINFKILKKDGDTFYKGDKIAIIKGKMQTILIGERVALNFLSLLSGVSTLTKKFITKVKGIKVKIKDTRKTIPNLRILEKYAVKTGGGYNHRNSLAEGIIVKDNHLSAAGYIQGEHPDEEKINQLIAILKKKSPFPIEIEVESLKEFKIMAGHKPDIIMLDNFSLKDLKTAVKLRDKYYPKVKLEASGGVNLKNVRATAASGVDYVSIGMLTDTPCVIDFSLNIKP